MKNHYRGGIVQKSGASTVSQFKGVGAWQEREGMHTAMHTMDGNGQKF